MARLGTLQPKADLTHRSHQSSRNICHMPGIYRLVFDKFLAKVSALDPQGDKNTKSRRPEREICMADVDLVKQYIA